MQKKVSIFHYRYIVFVIGLLALRLFFWFAPSYEAKLDMAYLWPMAIAAFVLIIHKNAKDFSSGLWISIGLTLWFILVNVINGDHYFEYNGRFLLGILISIGLCYPTVLHRKDKELDHLFSFLAVFYVILLCGLALICLYAALTNQLISTPLSDRFLGIQINRLYVFAYHPNEVACAFSIALYLCIFLALKSRRVLLRTLYGLATILLYAAISITLTRTVMVTVSLGCGLCVFLLVYPRFSFRKTIHKVMVGLVIGLLTTVLAFCGFTPLMRCISAFSQSYVQSGTSEQSTTLQDSTQLQSSPEPASADSDFGSQAEAGIISTTGADQQTGQLVGRDLAANLGTLTGRTDIWMSGLQYIRQRPITLLIGATDAEVSRIPSKILGLDVYHMHNLWLEILLLGGIPGFLLYLLLMLKVLKSAYRLLSSTDTPSHQKFLAIFSVLLMINGITEIYPGVSGNIMDMMFFVIAGAVVSYSQSAKNRQDGAVR